MEPHARCLVQVQAARVQVEVRDNGVGMAPDLAAHAFELFAQAEPSSDRSAGGLGLALVKSLVELRRGTAACHSEGLGQGSRFTVCLPRLHLPEHHAGLTAQSTGAPYGKGGNAQLDPWRAKQVDLSYEKYFGNKGYVSVAGFHKKLDSYICFGSMNIPLPGLSKRVFNLTAYYEADGFSARVSERYRSDYVGSIGGIGGATELTFVKADKVVDLQLGYDFPQVKGLSVLFQVNNLTDSVYETYAGTKDRPRGYTKYGRQMLLGLNYKL